MRFVFRHKNKQLTNRAMETFECDATWLCGHNNRIGNQIFIHNRQEVIDRRTANNSVFIGIVTNLSIIFPLRILNKIGISEIDAVLVLCTIREVTYLWIRVGISNIHSEYFCCIFINSWWLLLWQHKMIF